MSQHDNGFARAQAQYEAQEPPSDPDYEDCLECDGSGKADISDCCGAEILGEDICADCKEHCEHASCDDCEGLGYIVQPTKAEMKALKEEYDAEHRMDVELDEPRDWAGMEQPRDRFDDNEK